MYLVSIFFGFSTITDFLFVGVAGAGTGVGAAVEDVGLVVDLLVDLLDSVDTADIFVACFASVFFMLDATNWTMSKPTNDTFSICFEKHTFIDWYFFKNPLSNLLATECIHDPMLSFVIDAYSYERPSVAVKNLPY